jgi:hypothetical protein
VTAQEEKTKILKRHYFKAINKAERTGLMLPFGALIPLLNNLYPTLVGPATCDGFSGIIDLRCRPAYPGYGHPAAYEQ